nr:superoxide dismutase [Micromonospora sp. NBC_00855]
MNTFLVLATSVVLLAGTSGAPAHAAVERADTYVVSTEPGVLPEGIAVTRAGTMYVTSLATGAVYRGDVRHRRLRPFLPAGSDGRTHAAGVHVDRAGRLFVAGYDTATLFVYDPDGRLLAKRSAVTGAALNDLVITDHAVYVTDSVGGTIWRATLDGGRVGPLEPWLRPSDFPTAPGFLNGIVASAGDRLALVADQGTGAPGTERLWRIDLADATASEVRVSGGQLGADGLLLEGNRLYGVVNFPDPADGYRFAVNLAVLDGDLRAARVVRQSRTAGLEQSPTTLARDRDRLLWVNSQLNATAPAPPFTVTEVPGLS